MTNTLHRWGDRESLRDDYIIFAMPAKGQNDAGCAPALKRFLELAIRHEPVNIGDAKRGGAYRGPEAVSPLNHWFPHAKADFRAVIDGIDGYTVAAAVFDRADKLEAFLRDVKAADLGMCVNISAVTDIARAALERVGITRHSVEYSLPFRFGRTEMLPDKRTLELYTIVTPDHRAGAAGGPARQGAFLDQRDPADAPGGERVRDGDAVDPAPHHDDVGRPRHRRRPYAV